MVYFFYGEDTFAAKRQVRELVERYRTSAGNGLGLQRFNDDAEPDEVINALSAGGLFAEHSLVVIENPSHNKKLTEAILANLERVSGQTTVLILDPEVDKRTSWFKTLQKTAKVTEFKPKTPAQVTAWVQKEAAQLDIELDKPTANFLAEYVNYDGWQLESELAKLRNAPPPIDQNTIRELVQPSLQQSIFDLLDKLAGGGEGTLEIYDRLRTQGVHYLEILTMLGWQMRNLLVISTAEGRSDQEIASEQGINPYVIRKSRALAEKVATRNLATGYEAVITTDYRLKSGAIDAEALMEQLIRKIGQLLE